MMVVRVLYFPNHAPVPIHLHYGAYLVWLVRNKAVCSAGGLAVVEKCASLSQATILSRVRHLPRMNDHAVKIDQIDGRCRALVEREQGTARPRALAIQGP